MLDSDRATILSNDFKVELPRAICDANDWREGQEFALIAKRGSLLLTPIPKLEALRGIASGASTKNYRDRLDRF